MKSKIETRIPLTKEFLENAKIQNKRLIDIERETGWSDTHVGACCKKFGIVFTYSRPKRDLIGQQFGRLKVISQVKKHCKGKQHCRTAWECQCECGNVIVTLSTSLVRGLTKSCGCYRIDFRQSGYEEIGGSYWSKIICVSKSLGREVNISKQYVWDLYLNQDKKCNLSGVPIHFAKRYHGKYDQTASIDRIDSDKGYIENNIQIVHKDINRMKWSIPQEEFIEWSKLIVDNQGKIYSPTDITIEKRDEKKGWKGYGNISGRYWNQLRQNAQDRGITFDIDIKETWELFLSQQGRCKLSGYPLCFQHAGEQNFCNQTASLDRIDPSIAYFQNNIQWVHKNVNKIKWKLSNDCFIEWMYLVSKHVEAKKLRAVGT